MKKVLLVCASLLIGITTASATETNSQNPIIKVEKKKSNRESQPITFVENGVEFLIFSNGSFDFNAKNTQYFSNMPYNSNSRRSNVNANYRGPNANVNYTKNHYPNKGLNITRDRNGKIRSIGHVNLNYDRYGRITRAGAVNMSYERGNKGDLARVGGLKVEYNRKGQIVKTRGQVKQIVKAKQYKNHKR